MQSTRQTRLPELVKILEVVDVFADDGFAQKSALTVNGGRVGDLILSEDVRIGLG
jgi:hypothetical protein